MGILNILVLSLTYSVDSFLLAYIMRQQFELVFDKKWYYLLLYAVSYLVSLWKQYLSLGKNNATLTLLITILIHVYYLFIITKFYKGKLYQKLFTYGLFNMCLLLLEGAVIWGVSCGLKIPLDVISSFGTVNVCCCSLSKVLLFLMCYLILGKKTGSTEKFSIKREFILIIFLVIMLHIPIIVVFAQTTWMKSRKVLFSYFLVVQLLLILLIICTFYFIQKNSMKLRKVQKKLESAQEIIRLNTSLEQLKHDMTFHVNVLHDLVSKGKQEEVLQYMENVFECVKIVEDTFSVSDPALSAALNYIAQRAREKNVEFRHIITVDDFILDSHEICSLLLNILSNAMDATEKLKQKKRVISLEISPTQGGYAINCMNTYRNRPTFNQGRIVSSKEDTENHGKGISIIKSIVENHGGAMKIMIHDDMKIFELNCFIPRLVQGGKLNER